MLLGNYSVHNRNPLRFLGGSATSPEVNHQSNFNRGGCRKNRQYVEQTTGANRQFSLPSAVYPPYAALLPQRGGDLSSRRDADFGLSATATGVRGMPGEGSASLSITTNTPAGQLITSGSGAASFAVTTNNPLLTASVNGVGTANISVTTNTPILGAIAGMTATASLALSATNTEVLPLDDSSPLRTGRADISMSGTLQRYAIGHMEGAALPYTELSPASLASAVWDAALLDHQEDGSAGKALGTASSGGVDLQLLAAAVWDYATRTLTGGSQPMSADIADEIMARLAATAIPVDVRKINNVTVEGTGVAGDEWGPA